MVAAAKAKTESSGSVSDATKTRLRRLLFCTESCDAVVSADAFFKTEEVLFSGTASLEVGMAGSSRRNGNAGQYHAATVTIAQLKTLQVKAQQMKA